jgi:hypothetical protein
MNFFDTLLFMGVAIAAAALVIWLAFDAIITGPLY